MIKTSDKLQLLMMLSAICAILLDGRKQLIFLIVEIVIAIVDFIVIRRKEEKDGLL